MPTFENIRLERLAELEATIVALKTANPKAQVDGLLREWGNLNVSAGSTGGVTQPGLQSAVASAIADAGLEFGHASNPALANALALISDNLVSTPVSPGVTRVSDSGTLPAGFNRISIANVGTAAGQVLGIVLDAGEGVRWGDMSAVLPAITYDATGTEFLITSEVKV